MAVKVELVDSALDFHRALTGIAETLGDGFQGADLIRIIGLAMDDDDDENGTIVEGFINDLPKMKQEVSSWSLEDSFDTVRAIEAGITSQAVGNLSQVDFVVLDILKVGAFGHLTLEKTLNNIQFFLSMVKGIGTGLVLPPLDGE